MNTFIFTKKAEKQFSKFPITLQNRILSKLKTLKNHSEIFVVLEPLIDFEEGSHRLRIGDYRIILSKRSKEIFWIIDLGHRKNIYQ